MANFEFSKKIINIKICNKTYSLEDTNKLEEKSVSFGEKMKTKAKNISEKNDYEYLKKATLNLCNDCYNFIDDLLGQGASKEIFKNRMYDIEDCTSLLDFIHTEIENQRSQRLNKYSNERIKRKPQDFKKRS